MRMSLPPAPGGPFWAVERQGEGGGPNSGGAAQGGRECSALGNALRRCSCMATIHAQGDKVLGKRQQEGTGFCSPASSQPALGSCVGAVEPLGLCCVCRGRLGSVPVGGADILITPNRDV